MVSILQSCPIVYSAGYSSFQGQRTREGEGQRSDSQGEGQRLGKGEGERAVSRQRKVKVLLARCFSTVE